LLGGVITADGEILPLSDAAPPRRRAGRVPYRATWLERQGGLPAIRRALTGLDSSYPEPNPLLDAAVRRLASGDCDRYLAIAVDVASRDLRASRHRNGAAWLAGRIRSLLKQEPAEWVSQVAGWHAVPCNRKGITGRQLEEWIATVPDAPGALWWGYERPNGVFAEAADAALFRLWFG
jgi:hypothetical protein